MLSTHNSPMPTFFIQGVRACVNSKGRNRARGPEYYHQPQNGTVKAYFLPGAPLLSKVLKSGKAGRSDAPFSNRDCTTCLLPDHYHALDK